MFKWVFKFNLDRKNLKFVDDIKFNRIKARLELVRSKLKGKPHSRNLTIKPIKNEGVQELQP